MIELDLNIEDDAWRELPGLQDQIFKALMAAEDVVKTSGEVSILLTDNTQMQALNQQFRAKDKPTDVLSFPADPMDAPFLGDIAIGYQICAADAVSMGKSLPHHLSHMVIHGFLHLLGYDHMTDTEAEEMEALERQSLASLGITDPYSTS